MRTPVIAANWKMHKTLAESVRFAENLKREIKGYDGVEVIVAAPHTALAVLGPAFEGTPVALAGQNVHPEPQGAFTGEISVSMLSDVGCRYVILGHSERRVLFGETSGFVAEKLRAAQNGGLRPILCVGETLEEREAGQTFEVLAAQLTESLAGHDPGRARELIVAYEPVWAIGTGRTATPEMAQEAHGFIRGRLAELLLGAASDEVRIQYGGSAKPENIATLMAQPDIDGALVGGASLDPSSFWAIIRFDQRPAEPST